MDPESTLLVTVDVGERTLAIAEQRQWLSAAVVALHPGDGSRVDQSCIVSQGGRALLGAAVAAASSTQRRWRR